MDQAGICGLDEIKRAAEAMDGAEALLITAGAGMGVDSGLPDFRGPQGFYKAYPVCAALGLDFASMANPRWFRQDPHFAWGFYGHRLHLYRNTRPHAGFQQLLAWAQAKALGYFVFTSNVDGAFEAAGFDPARLLEVHGSIHVLQCMRSCGHPPFSADGFEVIVELSTLRAEGPLPSCPACGALARPNILMFGDDGWDEQRTQQQDARLERWLGQVRGARVAVLECGAGTAVPTVRHFSEQITKHLGATLVRINPRESEVPRGQISVRLGALDALGRMAEHLRPSSTR